MNITHNEIKDHALQQLRNYSKWGESIGVIIVAAIIAIAASIIPFGGLLIAGPLALGIAGFYLKISRNGDGVFNNMFDGFKNFGNALIANFLVGLLTGLAFILLIVPGIVVACGYSQVNRIMHDNPQMNGTDAMRASWKLMDGKKMDFFMLNLSFIGWAILCIFTLGIGFLFLSPYIGVTNSKYYDEITGRGNELVDSIGQDLVS
ncbi:MAG: DUF975 family protein [Ferruginibacter sp.]|nr:DUF975 family protein [Ferruginibacter sp.]